MKSVHKILKAARAVRDHFALERVSMAPFWGSIRRYNSEKFGKDTRAAVNVTLLAVSQAIAFAAIAGLPVVHGVLCTAVAALVAPLFAASRHTIMGPTNATAFMLFSFFSVNPDLANRSVELLPLLVLMVGLIAAIGAIAKVADLMQFVSRSVLVGYISGAAVLILVNQIVPLLGVKQWMPTDSGASFAGMVMGLASAVSHVDWVPLLIGGVTMVFYYGLLKWKPHWPVFAITLGLASAGFGSLIRFGVSPFAGAETFSTFTMAELIPRFPNLIREGVFNDISSMLGVALAIAS